MILKTTAEKITTLLSVADGRNTKTRKEAQRLRRAHAALDTTEGYTYAFVDSIRDATKPGDNIQYQLDDLQVEAIEQLINNILGEPTPGIAANVIEALADEIKNQE